MHGRICICLFFVSRGALQAPVRGERHKFWNRFDIVFDPFWSPWAPDWPKRIVAISILVQLGSSSHRCCWHKMAQYIVFHPFWSPKEPSWADLGIHFGAFWPPKSIQKSIIFRTTFLDGFGTPFCLLFDVVLTTFSHLFSDKARCVIFEGPPMRNHAFSKNLASQNRSKINQKRNRKRNRN